MKSEFPYLKKWLHVYLIKTASIVWMIVHSKYETGYLKVSVESKMGDKVEERRDSMTCSVVYGTEDKLHITAIKGDMLLDIDTNGVHNISRSRLKLTSFSSVFIQLSFIKIHSISLPHPPISKNSKVIFISPLIAKTLFKEKPYFTSKKNT